MEKSKIITHATYTYETTDGREFDDKREAEEWQEAISSLENICMFTSSRRPTKEHDEAMYVRIDTDEQAEAFNAIHRYSGFCATVTGVGFFRYDITKDDYVDVQNEIQELQLLIDMLS